MAAPADNSGDDIPMQNTESKATGYPALASIMGPFPSLGMYKRFGQLNSYNLLVRQAELLHLEAKLRTRITMDKEGGLDYHKSVWDLMQSASAEGSGEEQWNLTLQIRSKLGEYNAALLQQAELAKLSRPRKHSVLVIQDWLARPEGGSNFLGPDEDRPWLRGEEEDLVSIFQNDHDALTRWVEERMVPGAPQHGVLRAPLVKGHEAVGLVAWTPRFFAPMVRALSVFISTAIPSAAIAILYAVKNLEYRILATCLLTLLFASVLALTTVARPAEMFVATAA